jgi:amidase
VRGPLHGIPILIKDNIATADRMETTAGSLALVGLKPPRDAHIVTRLREAGAVILGKTNLSEWANFRGEQSISGWSGRGGQTRNPYALDRSPSGSSSGSAVAVAANLCVAAVGTETSGSITAPASVCGVVGVKPTVGLASRTGIIPITATFDTAGPMTRTVRDAAIVLGVLAGADAGDAATRERPAGLPVDFAAALQASALQGARIGVVRDARFRPSMDEVLAEAVAVLRAGGAEVIEAGEFPTRSGAAVTEVMHYEMKDGLDRYLATLGPDAPMKSLADLIAFNDRHRAQEMPLFGQQHFMRAQAKGDLSEPAYLEARAKCHLLNRAQGIDALMDQHRLGALIAITAAPAKLIAPPPGGDPLFGEKGPAGSGYAPAAAAGYPSVTVPVAQISGLPVGLLFYGRAWSEARLLALAADFETRTRARREPPLRVTRPD